ncbi:MAG: hypothetical protein JXB15_01265 [Anaerolineales bacterium]|nr:hypothetical protein [Anaerolineales bacterium]
MKTRFRSPAIAALIAILLCTACGSGKVSVPPPNPLDSPVLPNSLDYEMRPSFVVTAAGPSQEAAHLLAEALGIPGENLRQEDGSLYYLDAERHHDLPGMDLGEGEPDEEGRPTTQPAFDFEAINALPVLDDERALSFAQNALRQSGLELFAGTDLVSAIPTVEHATFRAITLEGETLANQAIDTQVIYDFYLAGLPLVGGGAKVKLVFDGQGAATLALYAMRGLEQGENVRVYPPSQAEQICRQAFEYGRQSSAALELQVYGELVYYAPPASLTTVERIYPHFQCSGRAVGYDLEGRPLEYNLPGMYLPAMIDSLQVEMTATGDGAAVWAQANPRGGTPPYTFSWSSSSTPLDPDLAQGQEIQYTLAPREPVTQEAIAVLVTDRNGLWSYAVQQVAVSASPILSLPYRRSVQAMPAPAVGPTDIGVEWNGLTADPPLPKAVPAIAAYVQLFKLQGFLVRFNEGEHRAWERDFRDVTRFRPKSSQNGGDDLRYIDNVDHALASFHGQPGGFFLTGRHDSMFFNYTDAIWGDGDLEWITLKSCDILMNEPGFGEDGDPAKRWGQAFHGLHTLFSYSTVSASVDSTAPAYALFMLHRWRLRDAWETANHLTQPSTVRDFDGRTVRIHFAILGPFAKNNLHNFHDYLHDRGPVSRDILRSEIKGFYIVEGPV